jgi:hypothetical protein
MINCRNAAAEKFDEAVITANKAVDIAKSAGQEKTVSKIRKRIKLYKANQPYHYKYYESKQ